MLETSSFDQENGDRQEDVRWDASSCQYFSLHGVEALTLTDTQLDLHAVMGVVLKEEAVVDDKLGIGPCTIEDVDLHRGESSAYSRKESAFKLSSTQQSSPHIAC